MPAVGSVKRPSRGRRATAIGFARHCSRTLPSIVILEEKVGIHRWSWQLLKLPKATAKRRVRYRLMNASHTPAGGPITDNGRRVPSAASRPPGEGAARAGTRPHAPEAAIGPHAGETGIALKEI